MIPAAGQGQVGGRQRAKGQALKKNLALGAVTVTTQAAGGRDDAEDRGIRAGDALRVFNDRGSFEAVAVVGESVRPGVVVAPGIWWNKIAGNKANANATTSTRLTDMGGGATFFDNLVEVEPLRVGQTV